MTRHIKFASAEFEKDPNGDALAKQIVQASKATGVMPPLWYFKYLAHVEIAQRTTTLLGYPANSARMTLTTHQTLDRIAETSTPEEHMARVNKLLAAKNGGSTSQRNVDFNTLKLEDRPCYYELKDGSFSKRAIILTWSDYEDVSPGFYKEAWTEGGVSLPAFDPWKDTRSYFAIPEGGKLPANVMGEGDADDATWGWSI